MANSDFFHQFRDKMRSLRPSARTSGEDWQALSQRLDMAMPATPPGRHLRMAAAALLLLLLASNLWWGFTFHRQNGRLEHLTAAVTTLKTVAPPAACEEVKDLRKQVAALQNQLDEAKQAVAHGSFFQPIFGKGQTGIFSEKQVETGEAAPDFSKTALAGKSVFSKNGNEETGNTTPDFSEKKPGESGSGGENSSPVLLENENPAASLPSAEMLPPADFSLLKWTIIPQRTKSSVGIGTIPGSPRLGSSKG